MGTDTPWNWRAATMTFGFALSTTILAAFLTMQNSGQTNAEDASANCPGWILDGATCAAEPVELASIPHVAVALVVVVVFVVTGECVLRRSRRPG